MTVAHVASNKICLLLIDNAVFNSIEFQLKQLGGWGRKTLKAITIQLCCPIKLGMRADASDVYEGRAP